jgi:hypothetical protein
MERTIYNPEHVALIKSYMGNDYEFKGDWQTLMPIIHGLVKDGSVLTWKICRIDGQNGFSASLGGNVTHESLDGFTSLFNDVICSLEHWKRLSNMRAN